MTIENDEWTICFRLILHPSAFTLICWKPARALPFACGVIRTDELVTRVQQRVLAGMGLIVLHSGHFSKIFKRLMGTSCALRWREAGELERVWVVNPGHPIVDRLKNEADDSRFSDWSHILFDQALLAEGGELEDPATFVKRLNSLTLALAGGGASRIWVPGR